MAETQQDCAMSMMGSELVRMRCGDLLMTLSLIMSNTQTARSVQCVVFSAVKMTEIFAWANSWAPFTPHSRHLFLGEPRSSGHHHHHRHSAQPKGDRALAHKRNNL